MKDFVLWFIDQLPSFLMSEPINYFVGFAMLFVVVSLVRQIINLR